MRKFGFDCYRDPKDRWRMWFEGYKTWGEFLIAAGRSTPPPQRRSALWRAK